MMSPESTEGHHFVMGCGVGKVLVWCCDSVHSVAARSKLCEAAALK